MNVNKKYALYKLIYKLPMYAALSYIAITIVLFSMSPMMPVTPNLFMVYSYAALVLLSFGLGYMATLSLTGKKYAEINPTKIRPLRLNILIFLLLTVPLVFYSKLLQVSFSFYGFSNISSIFADVGSNYFLKDDLIDEISSISLGPFYAFMNLLSFTQYAAYACLAFFWKDVFMPIRTYGIFVIAIQILFFMSIGTMSGTAYILICIGSGLVIRAASSLLYSDTTYLNSVKIIKSFSIKLIFSVALVFLFMVFILSSRSDQMNISDLFLYNQNSFIYTIFGRSIGDGISLSFSYISQGWYGLGNAFELDFQWTYGLSSGRAINEYYYRFAGIDNPEMIYSYPVRQELFSGYPAYAHWHTIFPWLASDFTFFGALVMNFIFAMVYGHTWLNAISRKCPISISLFALLTIGVLFISANSQLLDSKTSLLALIALSVMYLYRNKILSILGNAK